MRKTPIVDSPLIVTDDCLRRLRLIKAFVRRLIIANCQDRLSAPLFRTWFFYFDGKTIFGFICAKPHVTSFSCFSIAQAFGVCMWIERKNFRFRYLNNNKQHWYIDCRNFYRAIFRAMLWLQWATNFTRAWINFTVLIHPKLSRVYCTGTKSDVAFCKWIDLRVGTASVLGQRSFRFLVGAKKLSSNFRCCGRSRKTRQKSRENLW